MTEDEKRRAAFIAEALAAGFTREGIEFLTGPWEDYPDAGLDLIRPKTNNGQNQTRR